MPGSFVSQKVTASAPPRPSETLHLSVRSPCRIFTSRSQRFGGAARLLGSSLAEAVFSTLMAPIMAIAHTVFIAGLPFGRAVVWGPQRRALHWVRPGLALRRLWPQTLAGIVAAAWCAAFSAGSALLYSPFVAGALLAVPIAVLTSLPALGLLLARIGLWRIPDEVSPEPMVQALHLPVLTPPRDRRPIRLGQAASETAD